MEIRMNLTARTCTDEIEDTSSEEYTRAISDFREVVSMKQDAIGRLNVLVG